jgi:hypothetical protein
VRNEKEDAPDLASARAFLKRSPAAIEAISQRCTELPEYRTWLEQFNPEMLQMVEQHRRDMPH